MNSGIDTRDDNWRFKIQSHSGGANCYVHPWQNYHKIILSYLPL